MLTIGGRGADGWSLSCHGTQVSHSYSETAFPPPFASLRVLFRPLCPFSRISRPRAPGPPKTAFLGSRKAKKRIAGVEIGLERQEREKRGSQTHPNPPRGRQTPRQLGARRLQARPEGREVPGSTDCPGTVMQKSSPRFLEWRYERVEMGKR